MSPYYQMDVLRHHRAAVTSVFVLGNDSAERFSDNAISSSSKVNSECLSKSLRLRKSGEFRRAAAVRAFCHNVTRRAVLSVPPELRRNCCRVDRWEATNRRRSIQGDNRLP